MEYMLLEKDIRALAGLCYSAFEVLFAEKTEGEYRPEAMDKLYELLGSTTKYPLLAAGIDVPNLTASQLTRLMEEAVTYMQENPL